MEINNRRKILIVKTGSITISETFITDLPKYLGGKTLLVHDKVPVEYGVQSSKRKSLLLKLLDLTGKLVNRNNFAYTVLLNSFFRNFKPDVVLAQFGTTASEVYKICEKRNVPLVIQFHGYDIHNFEVTTKYGRDYKAMLKFCAASIVVSRPMYKEAVRLGANPESTFLNPCGVDLSSFDFLGNSGGYFLSVGRFVDKKGPHLTIMAFCRYVKTFPDAQLIMIGNGPLLSSCRDLSSALGLDKNIRFLGGKSHEEVREYLKNAFIFLQHSIVAQNGDSEGSPVALAEAGACGIPVVSTRHAGIPEIVLNGVTGILVDEKDIDGMTDAMIRLTEDKTLYESMKINSREHIIKAYSNMNLIPRLESILEWSIDSKNKKPSKEPEFWSADNIDYPAFNNNKTF